MLADFEHGLRFGDWQLADFFREKRMQRDCCLLFILGGSLACEEVRAWPLKMQVGSQQLPEFTDPQAGVNGGQIDKPPFLGGDSQEPLQLVLRDGAAFLLPSPEINLGDVFERVNRKPALTLEPVQEGVGIVQILIERLGGERFLLAAPVVRASDEKSFSRVKPHSATSFTMRAFIIF